jgi:hypothetical protein
MFTMASHSLRSVLNAKHPKLGEAHDFTTATTYIHN